MRESIPRQIEKKSRSPRWRKESGTLKVGIGVWNSQGGGKDKLFLSIFLQFSSVQFSCSVVSDSLRPHESQHTKASLSITNSWSLLKLMSIELVMPSHHLILCCPLLLPSIPPSIRIFSNESLCMRWPKYWGFSFSISPSNEHSGLISVLVNYPTQFKLCTRDYITTMYPA